MNDSLLQSKKIIDEYIKQQPVVKDTKKVDYEKCLWLPFGLLDRQRLYKISTDAIVLYLYFRRHIIRGGMSPLYIKLTKKYFDNGWLVTARAYSEIFKHTGWPNSKIKKAIKVLEQAGIIRIDKIRSSRGRPQNVFLLGRKDGGMERYFIDEVLND